MPGPGASGGGTCLLNRPGTFTYPLPHLIFMQVPQCGRASSSLEGHGMASVHREISRSWQAAVTSPTSLNSNGRSCTARPSEEPPASGSSTLTVAETVRRDEHGRCSWDLPSPLPGNRTMSEHMAFMALTGADAVRSCFRHPVAPSGRTPNFRRRIWQPAVLGTGLGGVGFNDLRRTATTQLVLANVDMKTTGTRLGHSDPSLTLAVYAQATSEADRSAADSVGSRFSAAMSL